MMGENLQKVVRTIVTEIQKLGKLPKKVRRENTFRGVGAGGNVNE